MDSKLPLREKQGTTGPFRAVGLFQHTWHVAMS